MDRPGRAADADLRGGAARRGKRRSRSPRRRYRQRCGRPGTVPPIGSSRRTCRRPACPQPALIPDAAFARRVYLDVWGLLPSPDALQAFVADPAPDKRDRLVATLLADDKKYAEHWISFWNDLLRNEDGQTYFSEQNGRKSITEWLMPALVGNLPYDQFVGEAAQSRPAGRSRRIPDRRQLAR